MKRLLLFLLFSLPCLAQVPIVGNQVDNGPHLPANCTAAQVFNLTATDGGNTPGLYVVSVAGNPCTWIKPPSSGGPPTGAAGGDLATTYPNPTVTGLSHVTGLTQGQPTSTTGTGVVSSPVYLDAFQFGGDPDVCTMLSNAIAGAVTGNGNFGVIVVPVVSKKYCSANPFTGEHRGEVRFVGAGKNNVIYTAATWYIPSGWWVHGQGMTGTTVVNNTNQTPSVMLKACNPLLDDNTFASNGGNTAPCAAAFNASGNQPQATVNKIETATPSANFFKITLNGALSGVAGTANLPNQLRGRFICIPGNATLSTAALQSLIGCWQIVGSTAANQTVPANSTTLVVNAGTAGQPTGAGCTSPCNGSGAVTVYLDVPVVALGKQTAESSNSQYFCKFTDFVVDANYIVGVGNLVNGHCQEGATFTNIQMFNGTVYGMRLYGGNSTGGQTGGAYLGNTGGANHSGPYSMLFFNYQAEQCEINSPGCVGIQSTGSSTISNANGNLLSCGDVGIVGGNNYVIDVTAGAYSGAQASSPCQKFMVGFSVDTVDAGSNSGSIYGLYGITSSLKDVFACQACSGTHGRMPEVTNGLGVFLLGLNVYLEGSHTEFTLVGYELNGNANNNGTWLGDGSTASQGFTLVGGDDNNYAGATTSSTCQGASCAGQGVELGPAQGTGANAINIGNVLILNKQLNAGGSAVKDLVYSTYNCTTSAEKNTFYMLSTTSITVNSVANAPTVISDCTNSMNAFPQGVQSDFEFVTPSAHQIIVAKGPTTKAVGIGASAAGNVIEDAGSGADPASVAPYWFSDAGWCFGSVAVTSSTSALVLNPFSGAGATNTGCNAINTSANNAKFPYTTKAGQCTITAVVGGNSVNGMTPKIVNVTGSTSLSCSIGSGANNCNATGALAFNANDRYEITVDTTASETVTKINVKMFCW